jgi:long-chain acyl-CoA synthetase
VSDDDLPREHVLGSDRAEVLVRGFLARLRALPAPPGVRVAFLAPNSPRLLAAVHACLRGGYAPVVLAAALTGPERAALLDDVAPAVTLDADALRDMVGPAGPGEEVAPDGFFRCRPMHFTSGTSGRPKAVWSGWLDEAAAGRQAAEEVDTWRFGPGDCHLVCGPLSHSAPLRFALYTLLAGGSVVVPPRFDAAVASAWIDRGGVTTAFTAPTHLQRLLDEAPPARPRMRLLAHAGSACPVPLKQRALAVFGDETVVEFYGATEGQFTVCSGAEWRERPGTVGRARPGRRLRVVDGQIWCRAPSFARFEYWGDPAKTAAAWDGDWFTVGDLGHLDDDGYLHLDGRRSDLIITGGVNVYPAEVERVLGEVPGVETVCVFGVDDRRWGQRVCAVVTGTASEQDVREWASSHLAPYKRPKTVLLADALPRTHSGKIDRTRLPGLLGPAPPPR